MEMKGLAQRCSRHGAESGRGSEPGAGISLIVIHSRRRCQLMPCWGKARVCVCAIHFWSKIYGCAPGSNQPSATRRKHEVSLSVAVFDVDDDEDDDGPSSLAAAFP